MVRKRLTIIAFALLAAFGLWLAFNEPLPGAGIPTSWNCAGSKAMFCFQR